MKESAMAGSIRKILCAIDLDGSASSALDLAADMAQQLKAAVCILHVVAMPMPAEGAPVFVEVCKEQAQVAKASMERLVAKHLGGIPSESRVDVGDPAMLIISAAERLPADLVVMATHGRKGLSRMFLGSIAEEVMRRVLCPVVTVKYRATERNSVARWMTQRVLTATPSEKLTAACARMQQHRIRSLPVVEGNKVVGMISDRDIRTNLSNLESVEVANAMNDKLISVTPDTSVWEAARLLRERKVGALPVLEKERLVGIISSSDLLEALVDMH
jgi:nucleotide-binding universal stress UspA family protein